MPVGTTSRECRVSTRRARRPGFRIRAVNVADEGGCRECGRARGSPPGVVAAAPWEAVMDENGYLTFETTDGAPIKAWVRGVPFEDYARRQLENTARLPFVYK